MHSFLWIVSFYTTATGRLGLHQTVLVLLSVRRRLSINLSRLITIVLLAALDSPTRRFNGLSRSLLVALLPLLPAVIGGRAAPGLCGLIILLLLFLSSRTAGVHGYRLGQLISVRVWRSQSCRRAG